MTHWDFGQIAGVLGSLAISAAAEEPLDIPAIAAEHGEDDGAVAGIVSTLAAQGLVLLSEDEMPGGPPILTRAGSQYLRRKGQVDEGVLRFLPDHVHDLNAREALMDAGALIVDEFRAAIGDGHLVEHARELSPPAFAEAVDERIALDLFAASVALLSRLSCGVGAGCVAEEILAVTLLGEGAAWFERELESGGLEAVDLEPGLTALSGLFALFEDEDVFDLFEMSEPADAAIALHSSINLQAAVADQRIEAWFRPFIGVPSTGHLSDGGPDD